MITVATCNTIDEALLLRSVLEGSGISASVPDELTAQTAPTYLFATQTRVRLQVAEADEARAREILATVEKTNPPSP